MHLTLNRLLQLVDSSLTPGESGFHSNYQILLTGSLVMLGLCGCAAKEPEDDPRLAPPVVPVMKVAPGHSFSTSYTGVVKARVESSLGFRVSGKVIQRLVDVGQPVKAGQPVMKIDRTDYAHQIVVRQGSVEAAKSKLIQAKADERRYKGALEAGVVTEQSYDQIKAVADESDADLRALEATTNVARDEADYSVLYSDADGIVTETLAEPGQVVSAGQAVVKVARKGPREAAVDLPETVRPALGTYAEGKLYDSSLPPCRARLRELSESADHGTRTFEARYVLQGKAADAPLGCTVTITPEGGHRPEGILVPLTALVDKGQGPNVWIVDPGSSSVHLQPVQIAVLGEEDALLSSGPQKGNMVVVQGAHLLHKGEKIRIELASSEFKPAALATPPHESQ